ncbi:MAG TPA: GTPase/DUF3482 domain-containing protein, partial [Chthoniobacteraceae bacterium]|jgi:hypothetical protein
VNHGKSSVVSTLAENDQVRISSMPGETVECQRFWLFDLFVFYDTPGFQNALDALPELKAAGEAREPLAIFRDFVARHKDQPEFEAECVLFGPVLEGAGVVYVVDGSEPVLEIHAAEMEILRLTGQPRLAIINRTSTDDHIAEWKRRLGLHFNAVREFNAHDARFADRLELLETLAGIEQNWKPKLMQAVTIFREEWQKRLGECAEIIVELIVDCLTHQEVAASSDLASRRTVVGEELKQRYLTAVSSRETKAHQEVIRLFGHSRVKAEATAEHLFDSSLFSDETWRAFGLDEKQLLAAGAISGAAAGVTFDLATAGHSIGLPTLIGFGVGAASAFFFGKQRPELKVTLPGWGQNVRLGGSALKVGPYKAVNFPWIILDRALGTFAFVVNRAHAKRDEVTINSAQMKAMMDAAGFATACWSDTQRRECERIFAAIRAGKVTREHRSTLAETIRGKLVEISSTRMG